jgi:SAM-dependent methyltransferase
MAEAYDAGLGPTLFAPFASDLAARAAALAPARVLEVAAGSGIATRALVQALPDAAFVATDLSPAMVELGSARVPGATWRTADALQLPFDDGAFDLVACQFGVMFFPDRPAGFAEMRRVLAPGGVLLCSTWGTVAEHDFGAALSVALARTFPHDPPMFLRVPHGYHDVEQVRADVAGAGYATVDVRTVTLDGLAASTAAVARGFCTGSPLRVELQQRGDIDEVTARIAAEMTSVLGAGPVTGRMTAHVVTARR